MKISIEQYGVIHSIENLPDDIDIFELGQRLRELLMGMGYQKESVDKILEAK